ncbi:MAG TPA: ABC transporter substrate-binding protein, partial [Aggregatilineales bacterium]|nr:ABC transporter substrate-binding protein [Aggregatilineales bacterium]
VAITFGASADNITQQFTVGTADYATLDATSAAALQKAKADLVKSGPGDSVAVLGFSSERPGINKESFRRALSQAVNRDALVNATLPGLALSTSRFTPPGVLAGPATPPDNSGFDLNAAKGAMSGAGVKSCILSGKLFLIVEDTPQNAAIGQNLIDQWRTAFGCGPDVFSLLKDSAEHVSNVAGGMINTYDTNSNPRPDLWLYTWTPDYPDANAWTGDALHCVDGFLKSGVDCGDADGLVDKAFTEPDNAQRASDYAEAETDWFGPSGTFPVAPLYVWLAFAGQQPWLTGATVTGPQYFANWTLAAH